MRIADGIEALEINATAMGRQSIIYPTLIWDNETVVLIDSGFPGQMDALREVMKKAGICIQRITKIILTHQDIDHIGNLPELIKELGGKAEIICHENEKPYIEGDIPLIKFDPEQMQKMLLSMPEDTRKQFEKIMDNPPKAKVDTTVTDGQLLPYCGGIQVIFTSGHTPGHISLYHQLSKTLVSGDSLVIKDGELCGPRPDAAADIRLAEESLEKYKNYDIETVICYHGGVLREGVNRRIREIAK